ncbi:MAG: GrpB family protein [Actinomycetota bacterium]|nr:GrpB family protein [Actinomycetota bacterium]
MRLGSDWQRLHPLSPLLRAGRALVVAAAALSEGASRLAVRFSWAGLFLLAALAAGAAAGWWSWWATAFRVTAEEVELHTGVLFRRHRRLPLARLETIDVARPLAARLFGLAQVRLEAVSDSDSEVRLSYLDYEAALRLRQELRGLIEKRPAPAGAPTDTAALQSREVVRVPTAELVLGTVAGRLVWIWPVLLGVTLVILAVIGPGAAVAFALAFGLVAALLPVAIGLAEAERLYGFTLREGSGRLHISRGLLNELQQVVPVHRIQAVAVVEPLLWRPFSRAKLVVDVAGYRGGGKEERHQSAVLLPIAPPHVVADVLHRVQPGLRFDRLSLTPAPVAARWRAPVRCRTYFVSWTKEHAIMRRGLLRRETDIVPHVKVQSLRVVQGPWQRPLGLATLHLDTAGAQIDAHAPHRGREEAEALAWASRGAAVSATSGAGDPVEVVAYDERWPLLFAAAERELRAALAPWLVDVEHIGSTAVPGLAAKPVIDIQVGVRSLEDSPQIVAAMESLGYEYVPELEDELPDRRYFRRWAGGRRTHQVHLVERSNTDWWERHVSFRDWLRTHDDDRDRYAVLKRELADVYGDDRRAYTDAKTDFVRAVEDKSRPR